MYICYRIVVSQCAHDNALVLYMTCFRVTIDEDVIEQDKNKTTKIGWKTLVMNDWNAIGAFVMINCMMRNSQFQSWVRLQFLNIVRMNPNLVVPRFQIKFREYFVLCNSSKSSSIIEMWYLSENITLFKTR